MRLSHSPNNAVEPSVIARDLVACRLYAALQEFRIHVARIGESLADAALICLKAQQIVIELHAGQPLSLKCRLHVVQSPNGYCAQIFESIFGVLDVIPAWVARRTKFTKPRELREHLTKCVFDGSLALAAPAVVAAFRDPRRTADGERCAERGTEQVATSFRQLDIEVLVGGDCPNNAAKRKRKSYERSRSDVLHEPPLAYPCMAIVGRGP